MHPLTPVERLPGGDKTGQVELQALHDCEAKHGHSQGHLSRAGNDLVFT